MQPFLHNRRQFKNVFKLSGQSQNAQTLNITILHCIVIRNCQFVQLQEESKIMNVYKIGHIMIIPHNCHCIKNGCITYDHRVMYKKYTASLPSLWDVGQQKDVLNGSANKKKRLATYFMHTCRQLDQESINVRVLMVISL